MRESGSTAILSRQNVSSKLQPSYPVFGQTDGRACRNEPKNDGNSAHKIPSDSRPSESVDGVFGILAFGRTDKEAGR